jgi:hypothetical protein
MLFYTTDITPRLQYISAFIGKQVAGDAFFLTTDAEIFRNYEGPKINYSNNKIAEGEFWILPHSLLLEKNIRTQTIQCFDFNGQKAFFKTGGDIPFDIFAACFFLLSRYEEYLPHSKDIYGRYAHENSVAFKENFLQTPVINYWLEGFRKKLLEKFPGFQMVSPTFSFIPTYDIDEAYSYKHKSWLRTAGAVAKAMLKGEWSRISERRRVLKGELPDPFDSYAWMDSLHEKHQLKPRYFFLVPGKTGKYDRNILPAKKAMRELIRQHSEKYTTGIHPSWQSGNQSALIKSEIRTLERITDRPVRLSRQHFIRLTLPHTYRYLIHAGIEEDYSMGYGSINGFRASIATPFPWYDLGNEKETKLMLYPFCFMEANSFFEQRFTPAQAMEEMRHYYKEVKAVNGLLITLWHNTFLGTDPLYNGWRSIYHQFIKEIS